MLKKCFRSNRLCWCHRQRDKETWFSVETFRKWSKSIGAHFLQVSKQNYFSVSLCGRPQHSIVGIFGNFELHGFTIGKQSWKWHFPLQMCKDVCLIWKLVRHPKKIPCNRCYKKSMIRRLFFYLIAESWFLLHFTIGKKTKNPRFFKKVFSMFFVAPYRSNSLSIPEKNLNFFLRFLRKTFSTILVDSF